MISRQTSFTLPEAVVNHINVPLLDEQFDPDEEEIFDHSELTPLHMGQHEEEEFPF